MASARNYRMSPVVSLSKEYLPIYPLKPLNMKNYFFGIIAIIIALGMSSFSKIFPGETKVNSNFFKFNIFMLPTVTNVENINNWRPGVAICLGSTRACGIEVEEQYYHFSGGTMVLNDQIYAMQHEGAQPMQITAIKTSTDPDPETAKVIPTSTTASIISNRN